MTLPTKGRRTITVDNVAYHWLVRDNGDHLTVAIEHGEDTGQTFKAMFSRHDHDPMPAITPTTITRLIRCAIADGWQPTAPGPVHTLDVIPETIFDPE